MKTPDRLSKTMNKDEQAAKRIAKRVMREMLRDEDHLNQIKAVADGHVENHLQSLYVHKHINLYCRRLAIELGKLP